MKPDKKKYVLVIHGGAGTIIQGNMTPEKEAIHKSIREATKGSFIVLTSDAIPESIQLIRELKEKEDSFAILKADIPNLN